MTARVVDFNETDRKISLSVKAMLTAAPAVDREEDADVVSVDIDAMISSESAEEDTEA